MNPATTLTPSDIEQYVDKRTVDLAIAQTALNTADPATVAQAVTRRANTHGEARAAVKALLTFGADPRRIIIRGRGKWITRADESIAADAPEPGWVFDKIVTRWARLAKRAKHGVSVELRPMDGHGWLDVSWVIAADAT